MPDTSLGITYPASTDHNRLWEHFQAMADDVNTLLNKRPVTQAGQASVSISASTFATVTVTFPTAFTAAPTITATIVSGSGSAIRATVFITAVTATTATIRVDLNAGATVSLPVHWIAVGTAAG